MGFNGNKKKGGGGQRRLSYIDRKIQQKGEKFLDFMNPYEMSRDTREIFKDMIYGNIDYMKHAHYFNNLNLAYALETHAYINYQYHIATYNGLKLAHDSHVREGGCMNGVDQANEQYIINFHKDAAFAYSTLTTFMYQLENVIKEQPQDVLSRIVDIMILISQRLSMPQFKQIFNNTCPYILINNN